MAVSCILLEVIATSNEDYLKQFEGYFNSIKDLDQEFIACAMDFIKQNDFVSGLSRDLKENHLNEELMKYVEQAKNICPMTDLTPESSDSSHKTDSPGFLYRVLGLIKGLFDILT